jgi:hypothetical protein
MGRRVELGEAKPQAVVALGARPPDEDRGRQLGEPRGRLGIGCCARVAQPHEVGVRVEDHHAQVGVEQQPLEHEPERVRLAGAGLPAEERVAVEARGVDLGRHDGIARREDGADGEAVLRSLAHRELRDVIRARRLEPCVDERLAVAVQEHPVALHHPHLHLRLQVERSVTREALARERGADLGPVADDELLRHDLAQMPRAVVHERDEVAGWRDAPARCDAVGEGAAVDGDRSRRDRVLEAPLQVAEAVDRRAEACLLRRHRQNRAGTRCAASSGSA